MPNWLYTYPDEFVVAVFSLLAASSVFVAAMLRWCFCRLSPPQSVDDLKKTDEFILAVRVTLFSVCGLVLAFSLVAVFSTYNRAEAAAAAEATMINNMDRLMIRFGDPRVAELRQSLHAYAESIVEDEWPLLQHGVGSEQTTQLFVPISRGVIAVEPASARQSMIYAEMIKKADDLAEAREARLESTATGLAPVFWLMVTIIFVAQMLLTVCVDLSVLRIFAFAVQLAVFGALLSVVFIFDMPFNGQTAVSPTAFVKVIDRMQARER